MAAAASSPLPSPSVKTRRAGGVGYAAWFSAYVRLLAVQGSWNYETMLGNGIAFCIAPLISSLPPDRYRSALARQARYFNAHPYLASVAVGALARAELDGVAPDRIERFRGALCGPLGSVGDQLIWAAWLPLCSLLALGAFGMGASALVTLGIFLGLYNIGHLALVAWGLQTGLTRGIAVAPALANPLLRQGPRWIAYVAAPLAGIAIPIALHRVIGPGTILANAVVAAAVAGATVLSLVTRGRAQGWQFALVVLMLFVLYAVVS